MVPQVKVAEDGSLIIDEERSVHFYWLIHEYPLPFYAVNVDKNRNQRCL